MQQAEKQEGKKGKASKINDFTPKTQLLIVNY